MTYTKYALTGPMLRRLSQIKNGRTYLRGNSLSPLAARGLVEIDYDWRSDQYSARVTQVGLEALEVFVEATCDSLPVRQALIDALTSGDSAELGRRCAEAVVAYVEDSILEGTS